jgi:elongation factor Ts
MTVTAADVKKLRDATGAGMIDAKKALGQSDGDFEKAIDLLRVSGAAKVAKRSTERSASNGLVASAGGALAQLGAETDFVAKNEQFQQLAASIVDAVAAAKATDVAAATALQLEGQTVGEAIEQLAAKIGEKLELSNVAYFEGETLVYLHKRASDLPPQVGVLVEYCGDEAAARDAAMQIAAMRPVYLTRDDVPADVVENERRIAEAGARESGKPEQAISRIVDGRVNAYYGDFCLLDQASVKEPKVKVGRQLEQAGTTVTRFVRFEAGGS